MNILYLHGLGSSLKPEKREILEKYGKVYGPDINYEQRKDTIDWLYGSYKEKEIDVIIGSSMGGFTGYYLSRLLQTPALLFNPALAARKVKQEIPENAPPHQSLVQFILGAQDTTVNPEATLGFIAEHFPKTQDYQISIQKDLEHQIPIEVFKNATDKFFREVKL